MPKYTSIWSNFTLTETLKLNHHHQIHSHVYFSLFSSVLSQVKQVSSCGWLSTPVWLSWACSAWCRFPSPTSIHVVKTTDDFMTSFLYIYLLAVKIRTALTLHLCLFLTVSGYWEDFFYHLGIVRYVKTKDMQQFLTLKKKKRNHS